MTGKYVGSLLELQLIEFDEKLPKLYDALKKTSEAHQQE